MKGSRQIARIAFEFESTDAAEIWQQLSSSLRVFDFDTEYALMGKKYSVDKICSAIKKRGKTHFNVESASVKISHGPLGTYEFDKLIIWSKKSLSVSEWGCLLAPLLGCKGFIEATVTDYEYSFWQNAEDPIQYERRNRDCSLLPKVIRDAPPPLNTEIIDISKNSGRDYLRFGYFESIGGVMWFSQSFFEVTGCCAKDLRELSFLEIKEDFNLVRIILDVNFLADGGNKELARRQDELRSILFPAHQ